MPDQAAGASAPAGPAAGITAPFTLQIPALSGLRPEDAASRKPPESLPILWVGSGTSM